MSWRTSGPMTISNIMPVPAWMRATSDATGKPHPSGCNDGWPKHFLSAGVSGIDTPVPSTRHKRWPCQRPYASQSGSTACATCWARRVITFKGKRCRAWQYAEAVKDRSLSKRR